MTLSDRTNVERAKFARDRINFVARLFGEPNTPLATYEQHLDALERDLAAAFFAHGTANYEEGFRDASVAGL